LRLIITKKDKMNRVTNTTSTSNRHVLKALKVLSLSCGVVLLYNAICAPPPVTMTSSTEKDDRQLSINLGNGGCEWELPTYEIPEEIDFTKTIVAGYPSGDKRLVFVQMEALTGWAAKDEWDFKYLGMSNNPFIKANYPHHEGIWGWEGKLVSSSIIVHRCIHVHKSYKSNNDHVHLIYSANATRRW